MTKVFKAFTKNENGATAIEYGLIASLMAAAVLAAFVLLQPALVGLFTKIAGEL
jgi:pilus assembly protein Flp/PilA